MKIVDNMIVYDSFEEVQEKCPLGTEIVHYENDTILDPSDPTRTILVTYKLTTTYINYTYDGKYWMATSSTLREIVEN